MQLRRHLVRVLRVCALVALTAGLFGCDHATKAAATSAFSGGATMPILGDVLVLRWVPNSAVAFSLLQGATPALLVILAIAAIAMLACVWWQSRSEGWLANIGFAAVFAGAVGNVVDRMAHGYVVDFIHVKRWPVFNVADVLVVVGLALVFLAKRPAKVRDANAAP